MNQDELNTVLDLHHKWLNDESYGKRADLSWADLSWANLSRSNLSGANLSGADLIGANLSGANLSGADLIGADLSRSDLSGANLSRSDLSGADLSWANLSRSNLSGANLSRSDLSGANLSATILDSHITSRNRQHAKQHNQRGIIAYRTKTSQYVGNTTYELGHTYTAPVMSWCPNTECHPGLYAGTLEQICDSYNGPLVKVYVRAGEYIVVDKGIRCARFRVLEDVND